ncbi:hypothetical protein GCM10011578_070650 [Streptomyces fuscichromogenes]|uniref:Uncharacterized protein n=1 Tax=Streptomyces fuscichromogenes TaxID=1324013 RepID=A0A918CV75_9ACTN|nr:hypothetical protein GCM10011578_070650 [Streptomyces fuscichromogenes]
MVGRGAGPAEALADESGQAPEPDAEILEALRAEIGKTVRAELVEMPDHGLTGDGITAIVADLTRDAIGRPRRAPGGGGDSEPPGTGRHVGSHFACPFPVDRGLCPAQGTAR